MLIAFKLLFPDGEWEPPQIDNPDFKGEWKPKQIDNPNFKGVWVHPEIDVSKQL